MFVYNALRFGASQPMHVNVSSAGNPVAVCPPEAQLAELLPRVRQRDEAACRTIVELLYPLVSKVVHANLPRRDDPEDLIQEVFMKIFSRLDQFRGDAPFDHWVSRMAVTTCLDRLRRQRVRKELRWADLTEDEQHLLDNTPSTIATEDADAQNAFSLLEKLLAVLLQADAWLIRQVEIEQKAKLKEIIDDLSEQMVSFPPASPERRDLFRSAVPRMRKILRPDQYAAFDRYVESTQKRFNRAIRRRDTSQQSPVKPR